MDSSNRIALLFSNHQTHIGMKHVLKGEANTRRVWLDGKELTPKESQAYRNHSPDGFSWGYGGSGCAQLALAVMLEVKGEAFGYQEFKRKEIANLKMDEDFDIEFTL
jgi:hypothetical protein